MKKHKNKTALIFGAASGIGRGVAQRLASEGANIFLADINEVFLAEATRECIALGANATYKKVDISHCSEISVAVDDCVKVFERLDYMINAAGIVQGRDFLEVEENDWDKIIAVNQKGAAFACQSAARQMVSQLERIAPEDWRECNGKIVNFSSIAGRRGKAIQLHYGASKAAVISITQTAANAVGKYGINVNAISPSVVATPMWDTHIKQKADILGVSIEEATAEMVKQIPLGRIGKVEDIAAVVSFLCSDDSNFITGQTINVDGGFVMN